MPRVPIIITASRLITGTAVTVNCNVVPAEDVTVKAIFEPITDMEPNPATPGGNDGNQLDIPQTGDGSSTILGLILAGTSIFGLGLMVLSGAPRGKRYRSR